MVSEVVKWKWTRLLFFITGEALRSSIRASMVFVGNTDHSVQYMMKHSHLFDALPKDYHDTAFLDRIHAYIPGWEVSKLRNELFTDDFGFIVDYIAEVLKSLRKEDHSKLYQNYFTLSNSITTRDKTAIEKTFSGLVKIIFPDLKMSKEDIKSLLDFSIECRKRVKLQLIKMDETFNDDPVYFEYTDEANEKFKVETLEEIEYGEPKIEVAEVLSTDESITDLSKIPSTRQVSEETKSLSGFSKHVRENQTNVSYERLFGHYLEGATELLIQDPYIRLPHQFKNFMELCSLIYKQNQNAETIKISLVTWNDPDYQESTVSNFEEIKDSLSEMNIEFYYEFKESAHDRYIVTNNGWKILLGRGLDMWQKSNGRYDIAEYLQEKRKCKEFDVVVISE